MQDLPDLTERQRAVLAVIEQAIARDGYPPTRAEIAQAMGFRSVNAAQEHLQALARKGLVTIEGSHRGIRLVKPERKRRASDRGDKPGIPLVGRVAAGQPILAAEHVEATYALDPALFAQKPDFLLRVVGMSMKDAAILDGDIVAVKSTREAKNGQIVVARLGDEATVKTFERKGDRIRLLPANPAFDPIPVSRRDALAIEGLVVGVLRRLP